MTRRSVFLLILLLGTLVLAVPLLGSDIVLIRFIHRDFPGGSLTLAGNAPIMLDKGTGSQHFIRRVSQDSSVILICGSGDAATRQEMGYLTPSLPQYVVLEVEGCDVKRLDISFVP